MKTQGFYGGTLTKGMLKIPYLANLPNMLKHLGNIGKKALLGVRSPSKKAGLECRTSYAIFDLATYLVLFYNVPIWGLSWTPYLPQHRTSLMNIPFGKYWKKGLTGHR